MESSLDSREATQDLGRSLGGKGGAVPHSQRITPREKGRSQGQQDTLSPALPARSPRWSDTEDEEMTGETEEMLVPERDSG
jgi:hypothetical protein